jgi:hypothetical protein
LISLSKTVSISVNSGRNARITTESPATVDFFSASFGVGIAYTLSAIVFSSVFARMALKREQG